MTKVLTEAHVPVMLNEILEMARPVFARETADTIRIFDGTFGRGGHLQALLSQDPRLSAIAFDRDPEALAFGETRFAQEIQQGRVKLEHRNYVDFDPASDGRFSWMLLDLGVSSPQLDQAHRGFSFYHEGPLDMRMDPTQGITAADIINSWDEDDLILLFQELGEIRKPYRVVRAMVHDRKTRSFVTTRDLAGLIERVEGWSRKGYHPATTYFLALRMRVNDELESTGQALRKLALGLKDGGRLAVLTFHSLEDRIVKMAFKEMKDIGYPLTKKVIKPSREEEMKNPRARSAQLRVFERGVWGESS